MKEVFYTLGTFSLLSSFAMMYSFLTGPVVTETTLQFVTNVFLILITTACAVAMFIKGAEVEA